MKQVVIFALLLITAYSAATTDSSNIAPGWQWDVVSTAATTSYQNSAYWSFVKGFEDSNTNCAKVVPHNNGLDWKQTTEDDAKFFYCLKKYEPWCKLYPDMHGQGAKAPISLSNCKHACYDMASNTSGTAGKTWKDCWDAANLKITLETQTMWTKLQFVTDFTWTATPTTWDANSNYNYWLCTIHNGCWDESITMGLDENYQTISNELYFQSKRTDLITNKWPSTCPTTKATDPAAGLDKNVRTCLKELLPLTFTERDRKTVNCLSQCADPTGLFSRRFASTDVQSSKRDGEDSMIDGESVSRKAELIKKFVECVNGKDKENLLFFKQEIEQPLPSNWYNDDYRKFSQFTATDNGKPAASANYIVENDRWKTNNERAITRNCLYVYTECENFRNWAKNEFQKTDELSESLKKCIMQCTQIGTPHPITNSAGNWYKYEQLNIHSGGQYWEGKSSQEVNFKQATDINILMGCAQTFTNDWNALIRELHAESSATILGAILVGLIAFLF